MNENELEITNNEMETSIDEVCCNTASNTDKEISVNENVDINGQIQLKLCTGNVYLIEPETLGNDEAFESFLAIIDNRETVISMMHDILFNENLNEEMLDAFETQLKEFFNGLNISDEYQTINPSLTQLQKVMYMCFDASNIINTLAHHIEMNYFIKVMTNTNEDCCESNDDVEKSEHCCHCNDGNCSGKNCKCHHDEGGK